MKRAVITGMGIYSCIGIGKEAVAKSLYEGRSGIGIDPIRKEAGFRSALTGILEVPDLSKQLDRRQRQGLPEPAKYAFVATEEALAQAGIDRTYLEEHVVGIIYGNDSSAQPIIDAYNTIVEKKNTQMVGSGSVFQGMTSTVTMNLSVIYKLKGINYTLSAACASGSHALGMGALMIQNGLQDMIICGGAQEVNPFSVGSFDGIGAFSTRMDEPTKASRPFDKDRDGLVPSGGAATLILESLESAQRRGATILGEIKGYGFSSNGNHLSVPNVEGPKRSIEMAIERSGLRLSDIAYINAHATSTPVGDLNEAKAIAEVFGDHSPIVNSTKGMTGHEMWMSGASEVLYSMLMMERSFIAPNLNFEAPDAEAPHLHITPKTIDLSFDTFLSNSFGFGGTNSTLIVSKFVE